MELAKLSTSSLIGWDDQPEPIMPPRLLDAVFDRLQAQFGSKLGTLYADVDTDLVRAEWGRVLASYEHEELRRGLDATATRVFPPTLGEFTRLCRPALDPEYAWHEARAGVQARGKGETGSWSHPAVFRASRDFQWQLTHYPFKVMAKEWSLILEREMRKGWVDDVTEPLTAIGYRPSMPRSAPRKPTPANEEGGDA